MTTPNDPFPEGIDLVFKTVSGHRMNADCLAKHFRSILEVARLPRIRLYDLRHTAATLALAAGVSPKVVSEQLGCQHGVYIGHLRSRAPAHAGRSCHKRRGVALWERKRGR